MEKVATIIPTYNRKDWLPGAIDSAMRKEWDNSIVVVVDDGSTDGTNELLKEMLDKYSSFGEKLVIVFHHRNRNIANALNSGISTAMFMGADYIEWMSDDDRHLPQKTALQIQVFRNPPLEKLGLVYSGYDAIWINGPPENGHKPIRNIRAIPQYYLDRRAQWEAINKLCIINGSTIMVKTEVFKDVGMFDPSWFTAQDFEMWIRIIQKWNCFRIPVILCNRYEHPKTLTKYVDANKLNEDNKLFEYVKDWEMEEI